MIPGIRDDEHPGVVLVLFAVGAVVVAALLTIIGRVFAGDAPAHRDDLKPAGGGEVKPKAKPKADNDKAARIARLRAATQAKRDAAKAKAGGTPPPAAAGGAA